MKDFYAIDKGKYQIGVDFGYKNDFAVKQVLERKNGKLIVVSSEILGKSSDFDTDEKREKMIEIITNQQIENLKIGEK